MRKTIQVSTKEEGLSLAFSLIVDIPRHSFQSCVLAFPYSLVSRFPV